MINDVLNIAASGLQAVQAQFETTSGNIANADTPGYKARRADLVELSGGGVGVAGYSTDATPGPTLPDGSAGSNVDLASESVDLIREKVQYAANAAVVRTADQMMGTLLDMLDTDRDHDGDRT